MLDVITDKLSEKDLGLAVKDVNREKKAGKTALLKSVAESANWDIDVILSNSIQLIKKTDGVLNYSEAKKLRNDFRKVLVAKKFGIRERYDGDAYWVGQATDDCIIIQCEDSCTSIILSPTGEILVDEGKVRLTTSFMPPNGYSTHNAHGQGLYSKKGKEILPCIFEQVDNKADGSLYVVYKNVKFHCNVREDSEKFPEILENEPCFAFDGGVVRFLFPELIRNRYIVPGVSNENLNFEQEDSIKKKRELISEVSEELFEIMASTHHRLSEEEICQLRQDS